MGKKLITKFLIPSVLGLLAIGSLIILQPNWFNINPVKVHQFLFNIMRVFPTPYSYHSAIAAAAPAVVNIAAENDKTNSPLLLHKNNINLGSGVIVRSDGYILTNNHVINKYKDIKVTLKSGARYPALIINQDPQTDLAVLKIPAKHLPYINIANSNQVKTGDITLSIGNPYGLGQTVTQGIISATGRDNLKLNIYENFIQTDAAINMGNSGGALVNAFGDLIGITTFLLSHTGGNEGIGFAIPSNMANFVLMSVLKYGFVLRGWLGIESQPLTSGLAEAYGIGIKSGVVISGVFPNSPAAKAGLVRGDVILAINNTAADNGNAIMTKIAQLLPGTKLNLTILHKDQQKKLTITTTKKPKVLLQ